MIIVFWFIKLKVEKKLLKNRCAIDFFFLNMNKFGFISDRTQWSHTMYSIQSCFSYVCNSSYKYGLFILKIDLFSIIFHFFFSYSGYQLLIHNQQMIYHHSGYRTYILNFFLFLIYLIWHSLFFFSSFSYFVVTIFFYYYYYYFFHVVCLYC